MAEDFAQSNTEMTDEQVNELYDNINSPQSSERQMSNTSGVEAKSWQLADGINANEEDLVNYAKQGYEYNQNKDSFNKEREDFAPILDKYKQIDEYAMQNPEWWQSVQDSYVNREQFGNEEAQINTELSPELQSMQQQLNQVTQFIQAQQAQQHQLKTAEEDNLLDGEINDVKEKYGYMDFSSKDEAGLNLESKVLQHAQKNGISSFRVAFRDFAHDKLMAKAQENGKEAIGKDIQKQTKLGILSSGNKSSMSKSSGGYNKSKSYDDLINEAMEEYGINK